MVSLIFVAFNFCENQFITYLTQYAVDVTRNTFLILHCNDITMNFYVFQLKWC